MFEMTRHEFVIQFVLNRAKTDLPSHAAIEWVMWANKVWEEIQKTAPISKL